MGSLSSGIPLWFGRGEDRTKSRANGQRAMIFLPRFGPHGCVIPYSCLVVLSQFLASSWRATVLKRSSCRMGLKTTKCPKEDSPQRASSFPTVRDGPPFI